MVMHCHEVAEEEYLSTLSALGNIAFYCNGLFEEGENLEEISNNEMIYLGTRIRDISRTLRYSFGDFSAREKSVWGPTGLHSDWVYPLMSKRFREILPEDSDLIQLANGWEELGFGLSERKRKFNSNEKDFVYKSLKDFLKKASDGRWDYDLSRFDDD